MYKPCKICIHEEVCQFKDHVERFGTSVSTHKDYVNVAWSCKYYQNKPYENESYADISTGR